MPIGGVYDTGTVSVVNGSTSVLGTGVFWSDVLEGDHLIIAGLVSLIASVDTGANTITLMKPYGGATNGTAAYQIAKMSWLRYDPSTVMYQVRDFLSKISDTNTALIYYTIGTPDPAIGENGDLAIDTSVDLWVFWLKVAGIWTLQTAIFGQYPTLFAPTVVTAATYTVIDSDAQIIANRVGGSVTLTLPTASANTGRTIKVTNYQPQVVISASANVVPINGGAATTAILNAAIGLWCELQSNGANWVIVSGNSLNSLYDAPTVVTAATYTVIDEDKTIVANRAGSVTLTLPAAASYAGRALCIVGRQSQLTVSASANVVPITGGSAAASILPAIAGVWCLLQSDGTSWVIVAGNAQAHLVIGSSVVSVAASPYTVGATDTAISYTGSGTLTLTLPAAASFPGRQIWVRNINNAAVSSASANISNLSGSTVSSILPATGGRWAMLQSNGSLWVMMGAN
jgi:hypothetical protein